jgi:hypothetical protein
VKKMKIKMKMKKKVAPRPGGDFVAPGKLRKIGSVYSLHLVITTWLSSHTMPTLQFPFSKPPELVSFQIPDLVPRLIFH